MVLADPVKTPSYGAWEVISSTTYPNRPAALVAKHELLQMNQDRRVRIRPGLISKGQHLCWLMPSDPPGPELSSEPER